MDVTRLLTGCDSTIFCEVTVPEQPLLTVVPGANARLPSEPEALAQVNGPDLGLRPNFTVSSPTSEEVGGFGRAAQAALLLDQVLRSFQTSSLDDRLVQLEGLDTALQTFLAVVMQQGHDKPSSFCGAIALAIRSIPHPSFR
jgi:hypothetical protein